MKKEALQAWEGTDYSLLAMVLFLLAFLAVCVWTFRPGSRELYDTLSRQPLEEDEA